MSDEQRPGLLDAVVSAVASAMDALGLNGTRLRWRWRNRAARSGESGMRREQLWRSARAKHKMCPACRALVGRTARTCSECGADLGRVSAPGIGRVLSNLFPGATTTTSLIFLVNGFWFAMMMLAQLKAGGGGGGLFGGFTGELMVRFGSGLSRPRILSDGTMTGGEWWRLITPIFLHGGLLHFFFNSYILLRIGPVVEELYGTGRYWVIYLTCGIAGSAASCAARPVNTLGASGAILGLIGLLFVYGLRNRDAIGQAMKSLLFQLIFFSIILGSAFGMDHFNHAGGFACGALLGYVLQPGAPRSKNAELVWQLLAYAGVALVVVCFAMVATRLSAAS